MTSAVFSAPVKNVILMIGDGMGPGQIEATRDYLGQPLDFESLPYVGTMTTHSADSAVTDSAAAGSAMATGNKVNNYVVSVALPGDGSALPTALEFHKAKGKSVGLVTSSYMTDATPAVFGAHVSDRGQRSTIAAQYLTSSRPNVLFGGGSEGMTVTGAVAAGFVVVTNRSELLSLLAESVTNASGQFGSKYMPYEFNWNTNMPHLSEMTQVALDILDNNPNGFFLMVEGGLIDIACHGGDIANCVGETIGFNDAFRVATNWAAGRTDTLILVTADHETGGLVVVTNNGAGNFPTVSWTSGAWPFYSHSATPVSVFGWGVNAERVPGIADNTHIFYCVTSPVLTPPECDAARMQEGEGVRAEMEWRVVSGDVYSAESSTNLLSDPWRPDSVMTAEADRLIVIDTNIAAADQRFYRLKPIE